MPVLLPALRVGPENVARSRKQVRVRLPAVRKVAVSAEPRAQLARARAVSRGLVAAPERGVRPRRRLVRVNP
jgi:hypothetical protein